MLPQLMTSSFTMSSSSPAMSSTESDINEIIYDHRILPDWSNVNNDTNGTMHYSKDMIFNDGHRLSISGYSFLFVISTISNSTVLYLLTKRRLRGPSRIDIMLMHLAIADLMVTFLLMPLEIAWAYTVQWRSTDLVCRLMSFFRVFGLYLSSFVLVCISIDRYYAIIKPLKLSTNRGRIMLVIAWISSIVCSLPQAYVFHLEEHPKVKGYFQCVEFHSFASDFHRSLYNLTTMCAMYACPLITFIYCYGAIYFEIYRKSQHLVKGIERFRRSNDDVLSRAKKRTLKMTITIVIVFIICWTPYYIICMWYWFDRSSVEKVSSMVRKGLFLFACTNSCMNPIVYGVFNIRGRTSNDRSTASNRHTSLYNRGDSSNQLPKHLLNLNGGGGSSGSNTTTRNGNLITNTTATMAATVTLVAHRLQDQKTQQQQQQHQQQLQQQQQQKEQQKLEMNGNNFNKLEKNNETNQEKPLKSDLNEEEITALPVICINCVDTIELTNLQKS